MLRGNLMNSKKMMGPMFQTKPGTNTCMASNHKSLHICFFFFGSLQEETLIHSDKLETKKESLS
jgi:hypothetical protein